VPLTKYILGDQIEKNEMGGSCNMYGRDESCIQDFDGETCGKEITLKTQA